MATKFDIEQKIIDNKRQSKLRRQREKLEFLIPVKISEDFLELNRPVYLKNSLMRKSQYLIVGIAYGAIAIWGTSNIDTNSMWFWVTPASLVVISIWFLVKFLERKVIIIITTNGLTLDTGVFTKWSDIEYLYFKTEYNDEDDFDGTYLVVNLKNNSKFETLISDLQWSIDKLGTTLYQCMKKYTK